MKDQGAIRGNISQEEKFARAKALFIESVMKPDHDLRGCAHNQQCFNELMDIRENVLEYLKHYEKTN